MRVQLVHVLYCLSKIVFFLTFCMFQSFLEVYFEVVLLLFLSVLYICIALIAMLL